MNPSILNTLKNELDTLRDGANTQEALIKTATYNLNKYDSDISRLEQAIKLLETNK